MMKSFFRLASLAALLALPVFGSANEVPSLMPLTAEQAADLLDGGVIRNVVRSNPMRAEVIALVEAPAAELAAIVADYSTAVEWAPSIGACAVTGSDGDALLVDGITELPWPITDRSWQMRSVIGYQQVNGTEAYVQAFSYVPGSGNIVDSFGYWLIVPWSENPAYSYVKYVVNADPGIAIPEGIIAWITRSALPTLIEKLTERHAEIY